MLQNHILGRLLFLVSFVFAGLLHANLPTVGELFRERVGTVVSVRYTIQREIDRQPSSATGLVYNSSGILIFPESAFPGWVPPSWMKDIKVFSPGESGEGRPAEYLGQDVVSGWHYLQVKEGHRDGLKAISDFPVSKSELGETVWGIGVQGEEFDYYPYLLQSIVSFFYRLPLNHGFAQSEFGVPGGPVFDTEGAFIGWAQNSFPSEQSISLGSEQMPISINNFRESNNYLTAQEFTRLAGRIPEKPTGQPRPWLGVSGIQPLPKDTAEFLGLSNQGAVVLSEVIENSPAENAGLMNRDIIIAVDGEPLPRLRPDIVVVGYVEKLLLGKKVGEAIRLTILRGDEKLELPVTLGQAPRPLREAERIWFESIGCSFREFLVWDTIPRRIKISDIQGVVVTFVKQNSLTATAGLQNGDWIIEVDGVVMRDFTSTQKAFEAAVSDKERTELVLLVKREAETKLLRVKLK